MTLVSPWEGTKKTPTTNKPLSQPLDNATRYLIELLQELNDFGFARQHDVATLERCKATLRALLVHDRQGQKHVKLDNVYLAHEILVHMEALLAHMEENEENKWMVHPHSGRVVEWPLPDSEVYRLVLHSFANLKYCPDASVPRLAQSVVHRMEQRFTDTAATQENKEKNYDPNLEVNDLKPTLLDWIAVLQCWQGCQDEQRSVLAANETFAQILSQQHQQLNPSLDDDHYLAPMESAWACMIKICTPFGIVSGPRRSVAATTGATVAARLWYTHIQPDRTAHWEGGGNHNNATNPHVSSTILALDQGLHLHARRTSEHQRLQLLHRLPSQFYAAFLQAIRHLPMSQSRKQQQNQSYNRVQLFGDCFQIALLQGKVSVEIMNEFLVHAQSRMVVEKHLGPYLQHVQGLTAQDAAVRLTTELVPPAWTARADEDG